MKKDKMFSWQKDEFKYYNY